MNSIGKPTRSVDWPEITSGAARYADDLEPSGMLYGAVLWSPHAHARIKSIDVGPALAMPGVQAVLTGEDLAERHYIDYRPEDSDRYPLARGTVRHVGDPIAVVAAEDAQTARAAIRAIKVDYRVLPALNSVEAALAPKAPALHPDRPGNVAARVRREFGDGLLARSRTEHSLSTRYISGRQTHATMEPHTVLAHWRPDEQCLHMWVPSQNPRKLQTDIAHVLGLDKEAVRLHEVQVGGDFGGRSQISTLEVLAGALSRATERPVKLKHGRHEEFAFTKSRFQWDTRIRMGCDENGYLTYLNADYDVDNGAYNLSGPGEMEYGSIALGSSYRWLSYASSGRCVYTSKPPPSSFRGAGGFQVNWTLECAIDELAEQVGIDPIDFRLQNAISDVGERSITGWEIHSGRLKACLEAVRDRIDWDEKRRNGGTGRGVGVACSIHVTSLSRKHLVTSSAALDVDPDGNVTLRTGCGDAGTGQKTLAVQAVAEVLQLEPSEISVVSTDTELTPHDAGAGASRGTYNAVSAARKVATEARAALTETAAAKFHTDPGNVRWHDGGAAYEDDRLSLGDLAGLASSNESGRFSLETEFVGPHHPVAEDGYENLAPSYAFAAHAVEVDVDPDTGKVTVLRVVAAHDSGTVINPTSALGQVEGGVLMGLGAALGEEMIYEGGQAVNPSYVDYPLPRATDAPDIETVFLESDDPAGPFGAKGLGEIVLLPTGAALTNAVAHAIGTRIRQVPLTPDRVLMANRIERGQPSTAGRDTGSVKRRWVAGMRKAYPRGLHRVLEEVGPRLTPSPPQGRLTSVQRPESVSGAVALLRDQPDAAPMGGGTDLLARETQGLPIGSTAVQLLGCAEMTGIQEIAEGSLWLGGAVTLAGLEGADNVDEVIKDTVREIATPQIRNVATLAGNLCQAKRCWFYRNGFDCYKRGGATRPCYAVLGDHRFYHAVAGAHRCQAVTPSDLATTLTALDAEVHVAGTERRRQLPLSDLYSGPGEVDLGRDEVVTGLRVPASARARTTRFQKFSLWEGGFAVATVCVSAAMAAGKANDVRVVLGGVSPVPTRLAAAEKRLEGRYLTPDVVESVAQDWLRDTQPLPGNHWKAFATANMMTTLLNGLSDE